MKLLNEREAAELIADLLEPYTAGELAKATRVSLDAAKFWKSAGRCPNSANLINLARAFPAIAVWLHAEIRSQAKGR